MSDLTPQSTPPAKSNPVGWVEIYTEDLQRAKRFYETVFGIVLEELPSPKEDLQLLAFPMEVTAYGSACALAHMKGVSPGIGGTLVYFSCEDCAVESARVADAGGKVVHEKFAIWQGFIAMVMDSEGNMIGLHSFK